MPPWIRPATLGLVLCVTLGSVEAADPVAASGGRDPWPAGLAPAAVAADAAPGTGAFAQTDGTLALPSLSVPGVTLTARPAAAQPWGWRQPSIDGQLQINRNRVSYGVPRLKSGDLWP